VELVLEEGLAERHLALALTGVRALPAGEPHVSNDLVDVCADAFDNDRRVLVAGALEELGERGLAEILAGERLGRVLCGDDVASEVEESFEEVNADEQPLLVPLLRLFEPLAAALRHHDGRGCAVQRAGTPAGGLGSRYAGAGSFSPRPAPSEPSIATTLPKSQGRQRARS
jgi:hypothetical protein